MPHAEHLEAMIVEAMKAPGLCLSLPKLDFLPIPGVQNYIFPLRLTKGADAWPKS
jgi:hypothetical protein